jgi:RNA polymerase sigma-70 factor (ECF subfamily)
MSDDRQLIKSLRRGQIAAVEQIYVKYKDDLLAVAMSLVGEVNTAEDCLQDVFVQLVSEQRRVRSNLKGYLLSCVVNRARQHLRKSGAGSNLQANMLARSVGLLDPANAVREREEMKTVIRALGKLSCEQREVIALHLQGDMKFREIAAMLGMSINTVQSRYRYGMEKLRQLLKKKEAI